MICPLHGQFIVFLSLRPVALQSICLFQESLISAAPYASDTLPIRDRYTIIPCDSRLLQPRRCTCRQIGCRDSVAGPYIEPTPADSRPFPSLATEGRSRRVVGMVYRLWHVWLAVSYLDRENAVAGLTGMSAHGKIPLTNRHSRAAHDAPPPHFAHLGPAYRQRRPRRGRVAHGAGARGVVAR